MRLTDNLLKKYRNASYKDVAMRFLRDLGVNYDIPNKGSYKIEVSGNKCKALMFYPKSGKLIIQQNGKNRAIPFTSENPEVLKQKILSLT